MEPSSETVANEQVVMTELRNRIAHISVPGCLYLFMYHGRKTPDQEMNDWGENGPHIGPLTYCSVTCCQAIALGFADGYETGECFSHVGFGIHDDLLFFDGMYYGDWEIQIAK